MHNTLGTLNQEDSGLLICRQYHNRTKKGNYGRCSKGHKNREICLRNFAQHLEIGKTSFKVNSIELLCIM